MPVVHITLTAFRHESRVLKQCRSLLQAKLTSSVIVVALWEPGLEQHELVDRDIRVWRVAISSRRWPKYLPFQLFKYGEFMFRSIRRMRREKIVAIHAHSVAALPVGVVLKKFSYAPLVYDAHELESRKSNVQGFRQKIIENTEKWLIRRADSVIVVGDRIADWYAAHFKMRRPSVVRNVPAISPLQDRDGDRNILRDRFSLDALTTIFIYQGLLTEVRAVSRFLRVFSEAGNDRHIVFLGYGPLAMKVQEYAKKYSTIHFLPAVPPDEVLKFTIGADVGVCGMGDGCLSYKYSLPNKFFEYLQAGIPVLVGDRPEQQSIVDRLQCGWSVGNDDEKFRMLVNSIDSTEVARKNKGAIRARETFSWDLEADVMLAEYVKILKKAP